MQNHMESQDKAQKILVADDSPVVAKVLSNLLRGNGYDVATACDGIDAVQKVYSELPDLVILDIFMPRMNGYQVCRLLKHDPAVADIPVVINTASDSRSAEFWSRHTGADAFMLKGSTHEELLDIVARALKHRRPAVVCEPVAAPSPEEILSSVCALVDQELYRATAQSMESKTILDNLCEGIVIVDMQSRVSSANRFACNLLGVVEPYLLGRSVQSALGEPAGAATSELWEGALAQQKTVSCDSEIRSRSGKSTSVGINVAPIHDYLGEAVGCVCLIQDITRRRQVEELNQLKNDLTDMIVHDLRTPLTSLLTGLLTVPALGELNADQTEFLNISIEGGQILLGMINDLLDISKMEDGSLQLERKSLSPSAMLQRSIRQITALAAVKGISLEFDPAADLPVMYADEDKLSRTIVNLLSNAVKFTPQGGAITITANVCASVDEASGTEKMGVEEKVPSQRGVLFSVRDTGEGIPSEAFERIFEKFGQVETRHSGRMMSTGLGLTFCKMVAEAHGGHIDVQSELGRGSEFSVTIPLALAGPLMETFGSKDIS